MTTIRNGDRVTNLDGVRHLDLRSVGDEWIVVGVWPDKTEEELTGPCTRVAAEILQDVYRHQIEAG